METGGATVADPLTTLSEADQGLWWDGGGQGSAAPRAQAAASTFLRVRGTAGLPTHVCAAPGQHLAEG